jgi:peroxiredoxin (alkyl hydroperoxide reductase subunit C)
MPRIGDPAPDFAAVTTLNPALRFSEWKGDSWAILFSHPADFTPVCTTELTEFARRNDEFTALNVKLIGLSIDSIHAHLAWMQNIKQIMGITIPYPMIADLDMKVASLYGMIHPGASATATVRAVFVIDPNNVIRALVYYPLNVGRNVEEVLRLIKALQTAETQACATPVNWLPGQPVVVPAPKTMADVDRNLANNDYDKRDFYLAFKPHAQ